MSMNRRPEFIPRELFREYLRPAQMDKQFSVDGIQAGAYINRCDKQGKPISHRLLKSRIPSTGAETLVKAYRPIDIVARARAEGHTVAQPTTVALKESIETLRKELDTLKSKVVGMKHKLATDGVSNSLTGATLLTNDEIVAGKMGNYRRSGVYFLIHGRRVVYVGQSVNVFARIAEHARTKDFEDIAYIPCPPAQLDVLESLYIHTLRPEMNGKWAAKAGPGVHAPLRMEKLLSMAESQP